MTKPVRCAEIDCIRPVWRDGLCWWCWQAQAAGQIRLDLSREDKDSLDAMTGEDAP